MSILVFISSILQLVLAIGFVALTCFLFYKIILPINLKIIDLCMESDIFRIGICITLALAFYASGIVQLKDFNESAERNLSRFFPLSFLSSLIFLFLAFCKRK